MAIDSRYKLNTGAEVAYFPPIQNTANPYTTEAAMYADQANQLQGYGYLVDGVGAFTYLGTSAGTAADYKGFGGSSIGVGYIPFITRWSVSAGGTVVLPLGDGSIKNSIKIDWGDGIVEENSTSDAQHTYSALGTYDIKIYGQLGYFMFNGTSVSRGLITSVIQWGNIQWRNISFSFCANLASLPVGNAPDFINVSSLHGLFRGTTITALPAKIFDLATNCVAFTQIAKFTPLVTIPDNLFSKAVSAIAAWEAFMDTDVTIIPPTMLLGAVNLRYINGIFRTSSSKVNKISSIPEGLFSDCINLREIPHLFWQQNISAIPLDIFKYNDKIENTTEAFRNNPIVGRVPELWMRYPDAIVTGCFAGVEAADNISTIPIAWGGPYTGGYGKMLSAYIWTGSQIDLDAQSLAFRNDTNILKFVV